MPHLDGTPLEQVAKCKAMPPSLPRRALALSFSATREGDLVPSVARGTVVGERVWPCARAVDVMMRRSRAWPSCAC